MEDCLFCKIINGEIPSTKLYEDEDVFSFLDINPVSKGHTLVTPKKHCATLLDVPDDLIPKLMKIVKKMAIVVTKAVKAGGFNLQLNNNRVAGQIIDHVHFHIVPRYEGDGLKHWEGKVYIDEEAEQVKEKIVKFL